jgi:hypothetical protein
MVVIKVELGSLLAVLLKYPCHVFVVMQLGVYVVDLFVHDMLVQLVHD